MQTDWEELIGIDRGWVEKHLNTHFTDLSDKLTIRGYTPKASGTTINSNALALELSLMLPEYVFGKNRTEELGIRHALLSAIRFFGKKNPDTDGKYGELLLFALVEGVLGCKMVAHKLRSLSNFRDQVKGGDGIFLGNYEISKNRKTAAYLIGESKIMQGFSDAIKDAYESINRFHESRVSNEFLTTEFIVARENLIIEEGIDYDELYERLTPNSNLFNEQVLVHPILIMYNSKRITNYETQALTRDELESLVSNMVNGEKVRYQKKL